MDEGRQRRPAGTYLLGLTVAYSIPGESNRQLRDGAANLARRAFPLSVQ